MNMSKLQIVEYNKVLDLAKDLKIAIDSFLKKIPAKDTTHILTWEELTEYIGETFDIITNRKIAIESNGFVSTISNNIGKKREQLLRRALKEYNSDIYGGM